MLDSKHSGNIASVTSSIEDSVLISALLMVLGSTCFAGMAALVKTASNEATATQAVLYRAVFSALPLWIVMRLRSAKVRGTRWKLLLFRGVLGFLALYCYLWSVAHIPFANVLALQQMNPVFVAFLAVWLLGERPQRFHYAVAAVCMVGALLVVRPTRGFASLGSAVALLSAVLSSIAYVAVRSLTQTETTQRIVLWFSAVAAVLALPLAIPTWQPLSVRAHTLLIGAGFMALAAQSLMTASYRRAQAHVASAFSYSAVPIGYVAGIVLWGERPDWVSTLGISLIVVGGTVIAARVRPTARAQRLPRQEPGHQRRDS